MTKSKLSGLLGFVFIFLVSCSSSTVFNSQPPGAKIYINESLRGTTPFPYSDTKIVGSAIRIKLVKEGYEDLQTMVTRDERLNVGALIGGLFLLVPFLWIMGYEHDYNWELVPKP